MKTARPLNISALRDIVAAARSDYEYNPDPMAQDTPRERLAKYALSRLSDADKNLMIAYAELGSERELGRALGVSRSTIHNKIKAIQAEIKQRYVSNKNI